MVSAVCFLNIQSEAVGHIGPSSRFVSFADAYVPLSTRRRLGPCHNALWTAGRWHSPCVFAVGSWCLRRFAARRGAERNRCRRRATATVASETRSKPQVRVENGPNGKELIVDESLASVYPKSGDAATNCVWDALALAIFALPEERRAKCDILVLGLGGGSVARILRALAPEANIVGVEYSSDVIAAAREHFALDELALEVVCDCALEHLRKETRQFDIIIDDVFVPGDDYVRKPDWMPEPGYGLATPLLRPGGLFVSDTISEHVEVAPRLQSEFPGVVQIEIEGYENIVFVAGPPSVKAGALQDALGQCPVLAGSCGVLSITDVSVQS